MDDTEQRANASGEAAHPAITDDLPFDPAWVGLVKQTYSETLQPNKHLTDDLRMMFDAGLASLTDKRGLFVNILMNGRRGMLRSGEKQYKTVFEQYVDYAGRTDPPDEPNPRVRLNCNLANPVHGSLVATMIHEYTHLATIEVYGNRLGEPWPWMDEAEAEKVVKKLENTYPQGSDGKFLHWDKWIANLPDATLKEKVTGVLKGFADYGTGVWPREALPHVAEIIHYLYEAEIDWWTTGGPIGHVADLLEKFAFTPPKA